MIRFLRLAAVTLVFLYTGVVGALFFAQRSLLYPGSGRVTNAAEVGLTGIQDVVLITPDGERLVGWWKPPEPGKAVIVYFHGNGGALWNRRERARALAVTGRGLLMVSYRGYSGSTGIPTEEGLRIDARTAYEFVARSYEPSRVVLYGESLGTGVAVRLATERTVGGLILDAPYTSTAAVAAQRYPFVPVSLLMHDQYRSSEIIQNVKVPILIMHGTADRVIPFAFGEALFAAAPEPKRFVRFEGAGHTNLLEVGGLAEVDAFLKPIEATIPRPPDAAQSKLQP
jgi:fermentation-respiration switch protein FrsA (DUF1100 family)